MKTVSAKNQRAVDFIEAGTGPLVILVHSSMAGARQWSGLMPALADRYCLRAVNLFGYGDTPTGERRAPSLDDYAALVSEAIPQDAANVALVGHSFGGAVAMQVARRLAARAGKLVLLEPSVFYLLQLHGRSDAFGEIFAVRDRMERHAAAAAPEAAAEQFISYWAGPQGWDASPPERRALFAQAVGLVRHEFNAVLFGKTTREEWAALLPRRTLVVSSATTKRPSREIVALLEHACPGWAFACVPEGGHLAPMTRPDLVNPIIEAFLFR